MTEKEASGRAARLAASVALMVGFVAATNRWVGWEAGIALLEANDAYSYITIAAAAPDLPATDVGSAFSQRFAVPWLAGSIGELFGFGHETGFRVLVAACVVVILLAMGRICLRLGLAALPAAVCIGLLVLNSYALRPYAITPAQVVDLVFVAGLAIAVLGLIERRRAPVVAGGLLAVLGRQSALPVAPVIAAWMYWEPHWKERFGRRDRAIVAVAFLVVMGIVYLAVNVVARDFTTPLAPQIPGDTIIPVLGEPGTPGQFATHLARLAAPLVVGLGALGGCLVALRRAEGRLSLPGEVWWLLLIAAAIVVQPLVISPAARPGFVGNEQRLSALALLPICIAVAYILARLAPAASLTSRSRLCFGAALVALLFGSLHGQLSVLGPEGDAQVALLQLSVAVAVGAALSLSVSGQSRPRSVLGRGQR